MEHGEKFNTYSHFAGALLALAGTVVLIVLGALSGDVWKIVSFSIYGATLVLLYSFSALYHNAAHGRMKLFLQKLDHNAIYLLIAGSYTPFSLVSLRGPWGWSLFGVVWGLALLGMLQETFFAQKSRKLSLLIYVTMGWVAIIALIPLVKILSWAGFAWVAAGGLTYTLGIVFYLNDDKFAHWHGIWHLFVLAGSALHFFAILFYVA
ncbi:MAG: hemolysin III [Gallionellales bacterium 35-53-114]|nr:MAG: hemolysin III [Gallionellales bacterium 35-53-114]OYZ65385.1 MAG: hemolysin III [Gallionellales bacterium 24-53-125]OZB08291.1 MAG: hemolysin III [Gallionellales bacterium 39-52-133]HQS58228.1 hemolysin III family protein [Gallionellaceae bacterium]HQS73783.1 hemolysin III family protein [Gallionellaceae bacterium]